MMHKGKLGAYAMKRVAAGAYHPTPWLFERANDQTIDPTTAWTAVSLAQAPGTCFYTWVEWGAP